MKWNGYWYGIQIVAETPEELELLKKLNKLLPEEAEESYEQGKIKLEDNTLNFDR